MKKFIISNEICYKSAWQLINSQKIEKANQANNAITINYNDDIVNYNVDTEDKNNSSKIENNSNLKAGNQNIGNSFTNKQISDTKLININIYNHNINHFIINSKEDELNKKRVDDKGIKTFRSSYSYNVNLKSNENNLSPNNGNQYNFDKKLLNIPPSNKIMINPNQSNIITPSNKNINSSKNINNLQSSNIKIIPNKTNFGTKSPQNSQIKRPASAFSIKTGTSRETSNQKEILNKINESSILNQKHSAASLLNPITTNITNSILINSGLNRSDSTSEYSIKNKVNTTKTNTTNIIYNKKLLEERNYLKGNQTSRTNSANKQRASSNTAYKNIGIKVSVTKTNMSNSRENIVSNNKKKSYSPCGIFLKFK